MASPLFSQQQLQQIALGPDTQLPLGVLPAPWNMTSSPSGLFRSTALDSMQHHKLVPQPAMQDSQSAALLMSAHGGPLSHALNGIAFAGSSPLGPVSGGSMLSPFPTTQTLTARTVAQIPNLDHYIHEYLLLRGFDELAASFVHQVGQAPIPEDLPNSLLCSTWKNYWLSVKGVQMMYNPTVMGRPPYVMPTVPLLPKTTIVTPSVSSATVTDMASTTTRGPAGSVMSGSMPPSSTAVSQSSVAAPIADDTAPPSSDAGKQNRVTCSFRNCGKSFTKLTNLRRHERLHNGFKPFVCTFSSGKQRECGKTFARRADLRAHERTHTGEKPYECSVCQRKFARNSDWRSHERTHQGVKPYSCTVQGCSKVFARKADMKKHIALHSGAIMDDDDESEANESDSFAFSGIHNQQKSGSSASASTARAPDTLMADAASSLSSLSTSSHT